jgi:hypothetical protein
VQPDRLFQAGFFALLQVFLTATVIIVSRRAANGQLKRNQTTGIRTPSTMRSDQAWVAGHRAALRLAPLYLLQFAVMLTFLIIAVLRARTRSGIVVAGIGGTLLFLALVFFTAIIAGRAAKAVDDRDGDVAVQSPKSDVARLFTSTPSSTGCCWQAPASVCGYWLREQTVMAFRRTRRWGFGTIEPSPRSKDGMPHNESASISALSPPRQSPSWYSPSSQSPTSAASRRSGRSPRPSLVNWPLPCVCLLQPITRIRLQLWPLQTLHAAAVFPVGPSAWRYRGTPPTPVERIVMPQSLRRTS